jgi:tRNA nucleotidyltransferase (CCA-adding enzyme)
MIEGAKKIAKILLEEGFEAHFVGGCVRDTLLDIKPKDYDIATNARPDDLIKIAEKHAIKIREVGKSFGVILFVLNGNSYEVATYRADGVYSDNRRPDNVTYSDTIQEDLARRDFTINSMALDMSTGKLVDPFGGLSDLHAKRLKTVGNPNLRFNEDYLRIIRFFRFAARFDLEPDVHTMKEIAADPRRVLGVTGERIGMEMKKILMLKNPSKAFRLMMKAGVFQVLFPELDLLKVVPQSEPHMDSVLDHTFKVLDNAAMLGADYATRMAALLHDCGKAETIEVDERISFKGHSKSGTALADNLLQTLKVSKRFNDDVKQLIYYHMTLHHTSTKGLFRRYINKVGIEQTKRLLMLNLADAFDSRMTVDDLGKIERLDNVVETLQNMDQHRFDLQVDGRDIMNIVKIPPGPYVGKIKKLMEYLVAEEVIPNSRDEQIVFLEAFKEFNK